MYVYNIKEVLKVYDGDTITVVIDLGLDTFRKESLRLSRINAPEVRGVERPQGLESRDWLRNRIDEANSKNLPIIIKTTKDKSGKYGRYICELFIDGVNINDELVITENAVYKEY